MGSHSDHPNESREDHLMIHIVDYINTDARHMDHWQTVVPYALTDAGYEVNIIGGTNPSLARSEWNLSGEIYYKTTQFENLYKELVSHGINRGDIIIAGDAWNPTMIGFKYLQMVNDLQVTTIGFWRDGIYDVNSKIRTGLLKKPKRWAKTFERALFDSYDYNCFISARQKSRFLGRYNVKDSPRIIPTGLPYGKLTEIRSQYTPVPKENIIILPHDAADRGQRDIFMALRNYLKGYHFIDCHELQLTSSEYYSLLNRAKAVMAINLSETDPTNIYEGMLFGCVPIVPDRVIYDEMIPDEYKYPSYYTQPPFLNFVRGREFMHDRVETVFKNYDDLSVNLATHAKQLGDRYFENDKLLSLIKTIKG